MCGKTASEVSAEGAPAFPRAAPVGFISAPPLICPSLPSRLCSCEFVPAPRIPVLLSGSSRHPKTSARQSGAKQQQQLLACGGGVCRSYL
uniref:Uncharacterized protein n=1 Tax=Knipowitschia caucasica TaxID=637954 RepID=A0AAV2LNH0_KNICA